MTAYSALLSFRHLLEQLLDSHQFSSHSHHPNSKFQYLHQNISSLQASFQTIFPPPKSERVNAEALEIETRDAIYKAQDAVEYFFSENPTAFSLQEIIQEIDPITAKAKELAHSIRIKRERRDDGGSPVTPRSGLISQSTRIVGQEREKILVVDKLLGEEDKLQVLPITGMAGIGKTTLARSIYDAPEIKNCFAFRAWVTVSQDYHIGDVIARLLNSMESRGRKAGERVYEGSDEELKLQMYRSLYNNKYLVVIDDVRDLDFWNRVSNFLPDNRNGSRIIITSRIFRVAEISGSYFIHEMQPLDEENSWILLSDRVFGGQPCPPPLERIGREIAKHCKGLPLSLTVIGGLLSDSENMTEEYWRTIAEDTIPVAVEGEHGYSEILILSYDHLPAKLKPCFLYLGAFPEESAIPFSKLSKLWVAEGFLELSWPHERLEKVAEEHVLDLLQRNLVTVASLSSDGRIKTCRLHHSLRDFAVQISGREKFFHSVKSSKKLEQGAETQRRVSVHRNIFLCLEDVYDYIKSIQGARSLLYVGPHHHHPLPFCLTFDFLRVLDAFTLYFIEFPHQFLQLIHLRYLAFTYNDDLPPTISQLQKLQVLMVRRDPKIIFVGVSFLPDEIWEMPQLRHLWFTETDFPALPPKMAENRAVFHNLQSLSNVNADSCTREVLGSMPNLKNLKMWVEAPGILFLYLDELQELESFKFTVLNPSPKKQVEFKPEIFFPPTLRKLSLSGCGLPWEDMRVIAALPDLEVLKLRELAFNGEKWSLDYEFNKLKFLLIEYLNFKKWEATEFQFGSLQRIIIRNCYELEEIPEYFGFIRGLELIEVVDCSPGAMESAESIRRIITKMSAFEFKSNYY